MSSLLFWGERGAGILTCVSFREIIKENMAQNVEGYLYILPIVLYGIYYFVVFADCDQRLLANS